MSSPIVDDAARDEILRRDILPLYFPGDASSPAPTFTLLAGQPGAGRGRVALGDGADADAAVVTGDDLRAFHPGFLDPRGAVSAEVAQAVAGWVAGCIRYAREHHRSMVLEGSFGNMPAAAGSAERFAGEGFTTRLVVVGSTRAESLLSLTSGYLQDVQGRRPAALTGRAAHDEAFDATRRLVGSVEESGWVDRVTVVARDGRTVFDGTRTESGFAGAQAALVAAQSARMGRFDATQWLSELHHVTDYATTLRAMPDGVAEMLVDLHETALRDVIPQLHIPAGGKFATAIEQKTVAALVALRPTLTPTAGPIDIAAPAVAPPGPERGGVSR
ncbi:zeta toxin family protein [Microbacterium trichothecenolyticum]|uniref:UDP-N-acetylglucosamine kinase n=1 Tax=Microbacterium trichothecenolyticum TaxID=69370 RepID=A0A0M2HED6_MICTR|nr:zeta toxin family protein [Microbacterium trichothecenolyticum]KJL45004.1 Toxin PezT [Microbacterium trichothecenolyticum]